MIPTDVQDKVFSITGAFETRSTFGSVTGNGDGMCLRAGLLQWSLGMATLQPLLKEMLSRSPELFVEHLGPVRGRMLEALANGRASWRDAARELTGAALVLRARDLLPEWRAGLSAVMDSPDGRHAQRTALAPMLEQAWMWCQDYELASERALCLFLDIRVQNGTIEPLCKSRILDRFARGMSDRDKLAIVADERSTDVKSRLRSGALSRKMCIVTGKGDVAGRSYDLLAEFGLTDAAIAS